MSDETRQERIAFYSAGLAAWFQTKLEFDKTLVTLSSFGIGLLVTVEGLRPRSWVQLPFYGVALLGFLVTVVVALLILGRNARFLERVLKNPDEKHDVVLSWADRVTSWAFGIAIAAVVSLAACKAITYFGDSSMSEKKPTAADSSGSESTKVGPRAPDGAQQDNLHIHSFNGVQNLRPSATAPDSAPAAEPAAADSAGSDSTTSASGGQTE